MKISSSQIKAFSYSQITLKYAKRLDLYFLDRYNNAVYYSLDDSNLVSNVQSVVVRSKAHVRLLVSSGADQGVHLGDVDVVQLLNSRLDLMLVGLNVADEEKCVVIFNLLHGRLGSEGVLDDVVSIHLVPLGCGLARILWLPINRKAHKYETLIETFTWLACRCVACRT